jgi:2-dehydropantoate 2-reductase
MRIAIIGPGAMGSLFAALLSRAGNEVILLDKDRRRARLLARRGIKVEGASGEFTARVNVVAAPFTGCSVPDLTIVLVKACHTASAAAQWRGVLKSSPTVLTLQNGIGNLEILQKVAGDAVIGGTTAQGATLLSPGRVRHAGAGVTILGEPSGRITSRLRRIAATFREVGIQVRLTRDLQRALWEKLIVNCAVNALGAITRLPNGALVECEGARLVLRAAAREAAAVARAVGVNIGKADPAPKVEKGCRATASNLNSMLQDVLRQKPTEIEQINGAVVRAGESLGIPTPVNELLTELIRAIEASYARQARESPRGRCATEP